MDFRVRVLSFLVSASLTFPGFSMASVIFKPGEKVKYVAPGDEEMSGKAEELFHIGQTAEKEGNLKRAIRAYKTLVQRHGKDALAPGALFRAAELQEQLHNYIVATEWCCSQLGNKHRIPQSDESQHAQCRIGGIY